MSVTRSPHTDNERINNDPNRIAGVQSATPQGRSRGLRRRYGAAAMERTEQDAMDRGGPLEMRVEVAAATPESEQRWERRSDALAAWLLAEWQRDRKEAA